MAGIDQAYLGRITCMEIEIIDLPEIDLIHDTVVVIDVLRAFTTSAFAAPFAMVTIFQENQLFLRHHWF